MIARKGYTLERFLVFLTVGTQLPFDRLVKACELAQSSSNLDFDVTYQVGQHGYHPKVGRAREVMSRGEFEDTLRLSDLVITHAGIGTIVSCISIGKPLIVMPRQAALGEHRNDHQIATAKAIGSEIMVASNASEIGDFITDAVIRRKPGELRNNPLNTDFSNKLMNIIGF
nr:glycosyltransferase [Stenotrophomonas sp. CFBP 13718]